MFSLLIFLLLRIYSNSFLKDKWEDLQIRLFEAPLGESLVMYKTLQPEILIFQNQTKYFDWTNQVNTDNDSPPHRKIHVLALHFKIIVAWYVVPIFIYFDGVRYCSTTLHLIVIKLPLLLSILVNALFYVVCTVFVYFRG